MSTDPDCLNEQHNVIIFDLAEMGSSMLDPYVFVIRISGSR
jgi:hypothetical protein